MNVHTIDLHFQGIPEVIGSFLIDLGSGWALVESGPHSCWPHLVAGLAEHGLTPNDIDHVLLTHIHLDHAGAAWALAQLGATIHVHPAGAPHLIHPEKLISSARRIYQEKMDILWGEIQPIDESMIRIAHDGECITLGHHQFIPHDTPGHAVHHLAWQWGKTLFTGDVGGIHIREGLVAPPCPPPEFQWEDWLVSIQKIRELDLEQIVLTHYGPVKEISQHLDELEKAIEKWVHYFEQQPDWNDQESLTRDFISYIHQDFYPPDMDASLQEQYDLANPPWMSVAGITRYLKKKAESNRGAS